MLAPEGAEVAAQEWDVLVVVVGEAIGLLAAVDRGDDGFSVIVVVPLAWSEDNKKIAFFFPVPGMALLFALSTGSLWRTFLQGSAGR